MAYVSRRAVTIIGHDFDHKSDAGRAVTFVGNFFVVAAVGCADPFLDGALNVVFRNVVFTRFLQSELQTHVTGRIGAAQASGYGNFLTDFRRNFSANSVVFTFFMFNVGPFRVSGHENSPLCLPPFGSAKAVQHDGGRGPYAQMIVSAGAVNRL